MANITAKPNFTSGSAMNLLDPNTWVGGVVPGPSDVAIIPSQAGHARIRWARFGYLPWEGKSSVAAGAFNDNQFGTNEDRAGIYCTDIQNSGLYQHPGCDYTTSGSIFIGTNQNYDLYSSFVKIDFTGSYLSSTDYFLSCSIDHSWRPWAISNIMTGSNDYSFTGYATGPIQYNARVYPANANGEPAWNKYELTGSQQWYVGAIRMGDISHLEIKDQAHLILVSPNGGTYGENIDLRTYAPYGSVVKITDEAIIENSGSSNESTNQQNGLYGYSTSGITVIISGSSNYSSSFLSKSAQAGEDYITIDNSSSFSAGDYITIQSKGSYQVGEFNLPDNVSSGSYNYTFKYGQLAKLPTGSAPDDLNNFDKGIELDDSPVTSFTPTNIQTPGFTHDIMNDEIVQIVSMSGHTATIAKLMGKNGAVQEDKGTYTYKEFIETFGTTTNFYTGNKRAILIDSQHKSYKKGDSLVINDKAYNIHSISSHLSQSFLADFTNGAEPTEVFQVPEYRFTGSRYGLSTDTNTHRWLSRYNSYLDGGWASGSRGGIRSFYMNSASFHRTGNPSTLYENYMGDTIRLKDVLFDDGEITISGSLCRDFGSYHSTSTIAIGWAGLSTWPDANYEQLQTGMTYNPSAPRNFRYFILNGTYLSLNGPREGRSTIWRLDGDANYNFNPTLLPPANHTGSGESFHLKTVIEADKTLATHYYGNSSGEYKMVSHQHLPIKSPIGISIRRYASIFSISIKQRYQLAILDTTDPFSKNDEIREGGLLYNHEANKVTKWWATEIEDAYGFQNITDQWWRNRGSGSIQPYRHSYNRTNTYVNYNSSSVNVDNGVTYGGPYYNSDSAYVPNRGDAAPSNNYAYGGYSFQTVDLGDNVVFDTVGAFFNQGEENDYSETITGVKIEVSDDVVNGGWELVYGPQDDERDPTGIGAMRYYTFPSGSVNKRFIKFSLYESGYNDFGKFSVFNFTSGSNGEQGDVLNKIKLKNANNFKVGDAIVFWNKALYSSTYYNRIIYNNQRYIFRPANVAGVATTGYATNGTVGGLERYRTITAISGSVITLDRAPAYCAIGKGSLVIKLNRGNLKFKANSARHACWINPSAGSPSNFIQDISHVFVQGGGIYLRQNVGGNVNNSNVPLRVEDVGVSGYYGSYAGINIQAPTFLGRNLVSTNAMIFDGHGYGYNTPIQSSRKAFNTFTVDQYTSKVWTHRSYTPYIESNFQMTLLGAGIFLSPTHTVGMSSIYGIIRIANSYFGASNYNPFSNIPLWYPVRRNIYLDNILIDARYLNGTSTIPYSQYQTMDPAMNFRPWQLSSNISIDARKSTLLYPTYNTSLFNAVDGDTANEGTYIKKYHGIGNPSVITGYAYGGSGYQTQKNPNTNEYTIYKDIPQANSGDSRYAAPIYQVVFYTTKEMEVTIQSSFDYRIPKYLANQRSAYSNTADYSIGSRYAYDFDGQNYPSLMLVDITNHRNLLYKTNLKNFSDDTFESHEFNHKVKIPPFTQIGLWLYNIQGQYAAAGSSGGEIMVYKNMQTNLLIDANNKNNIHVSSDTFNSSRLFHINAENNTILGPPGSPNYGAQVITRAANDTNSIIRFNKIKL